MEAITIDHHKCREFAMEHFTAAGGVDPSLSDDHNVRRWQYSLYEGAVRFVQITKGFDHNTATEVVAEIYDSLAKTGYFNQE